MSSIRRYGTRNETETVTHCPACRAENPEPTIAALCPACGAILAATNRRRIRLSLAMAATGGLCILAASLMLLFSGDGIRENTVMLATVVPLLVLGAVVGFLGVQGIRRVVNVITLRDTPEARRFLIRVDLSSLGTAACFLILGLCAGYAVKAGPSRYEQMSEAFKGSLGDFARLVPRAELNAEIDREKVGDARIVGKIVAIDQGQSFKEVNADGLSFIQQQLPKDVRADNPDEVGTVLLLDWERRKTGTYGSVKITGYAYRVHCQLFLIDATHKTLLAKRTFDGDPPPGAVPSGEDGYGGFPTQSILAYLRTLPQEPIATH